MSRKSQHSVTINVKLDGEHYRQYCVAPGPKAEQASITPSAAWAHLKLGDKYHLRSWKAKACGVSYRSSDSRPEPRLRPGDRITFEMGHEPAQSPEVPPTTEAVP